MHLKILLFTTESVDALLVGVALSVLPALTELSENTSRSDVVVVVRGNDVFVGWLSWPRSTKEELIAAEMAIVESDF